MERGTKHVPISHRTFKGSKISLAAMSQHFH